MIYNDLWLVLQLFSMRHAEKPAQSSSAWEQMTLKVERRLLNTSMVDTTWGPTQNSPIGQGNSV